MNIYSALLVITVFILVCAYCTGWQELENENTVPYTTGKRVLVGLWRIFIGIATLFIAVGGTMLLSTSIITVVNYFI